MKVKVGQKVRIRPDLGWSMDASPGLTERMIESAGQVATILEIYKGGTECRFVEPIGGNHYSWSIDWLIPMTVEYESEEL